MEGKFTPKDDGSLMSSHNTNNFGIGSALNQYQNIFSYTPFALRPLQFDNTGMLIQSGR